MTDTSSTPQSDNMPIFTVSDLASAVKRTVEDRFGVVRLKAELSGVSRPRSGHLYFALKDEKAVIDGVMWRGSASRLSFEPEDGLAVVVEGKLTTYAARSKYQLIVERMTPDGVGALMAQLERRKQQLAEEGLFEQSRKKAMPVLPSHIGIVTSPSGAVIRDILHRLADRFPSRATLWPVKVQGEGAADEIANAIRGFNAMPDDQRPDLLIVARGGGSLEDLWSFNEETVVRAAANSGIPLISAVGHETDTTLIDYASDRRAPTPTGAAEMAVPVRTDLLATVADLSRRLDLSTAKGIEMRRERVTALSRALPSPRDLLGLAEQRVDDLGSRLPKALAARLVSATAVLNRLTGALSLNTLKRQLDRAKNDTLGLEKRLQPALERSLGQKQDRLSGASRLLSSLSYQGVLDRGFALVRDEAGKPLTSAAVLESGQAVSLTFKDGARGAVIDGEAGAMAEQSPTNLAKASKPRKSAPAQPRLKKSSVKKPKINQGELF